MAYYPTGYSNQPIDFSQASKALLQSAMQMKVNEYKQRQSELSESEKYILKAADLDTIPEVSGKMREVFDKKVYELKDFATQKVRERNGRLTSADKAEIEKRFADTQNFMTQKKLTLKALADAKTKIPSMKRDMFNVDGYAEELGRLEEAYEKGEDITTADISTLSTKYYTPETETDTFLREFKGIMAGGKLPLSSSLTFKGGKMVITSETDKTTATQRVQATIMNSPKLLGEVIERSEDGTPTVVNGQYVIDQEKLNQKVGEYLPLVSVESTNEKRAPSGGGGGGTSGAGNKLTIGVSPTTTQTGAAGTELKLGGQGFKKSDIGEVYDSEGRKVTMRDVEDITPLSIKFGDDGNMWLTFSKKGGAKRINGQVAYGTGDNAYTAEQLKKMMSTVEGLKDKAGDKIPKGKVVATELDSDKTVYEETPEGLKVTFKVRDELAFGRVRGKEKKEIGRETVSFIIPTAFDEKADATYTKRIDPADRTKWVDDADLRKVVDGMGNTTLGQAMQRWLKGETDISQVRKEERAKKTNNLYEFLGEDQ